MSKDWTGNSKATWAMLAASNHSDGDRAEFDYYATDPRAIDMLISDGGAKLSHNVWEVACGEGHLSKRLIELGYAVKSTDLIDRSFGTGGVDLLSIKGENIWDGDILTNPPYAKSTEFVEQSLKLVTPGNSVYMFLKLQFLEGKTRRKLFDRKELKTVYVSSGRIVCAKNGDFEAMKKIGSAVCYAWFHWQKGYHGDPVIKWIN